MDEIFYSVIDINNEHKNVISNDITLDNATIFLKALFNEYPNESELSYKIVRQPLRVLCQEI